ncbi:MAG: hypothetical protein V1782_04315 [Pseudomonadota bacterium]
MAFQITGNTSLYLCPRQSGQLIQQPGRIWVTLCEDLSSEEALATCARIITYFKKNGKKGERMGRFLDRLGLETFQATVLAG